MTEVVREPTLGVFRSIHHPHGRPWPMVFAQAVVQPMAVLFLPLMILSLVAALQQAPLLGYLIWGFPAAAIASSVWTAFDLRRTIAEIQLFEGSVAVRTVHQVSESGDMQVRAIPLYDVRDYGSWMMLAAGDADFVIYRDEWPRYLELKRALKSRLYPDVPRPLH